MTEESIESLKAELAKCKQENDTKSEFLSIIAHQLRTPLSGIKWTFQMLLNGDLGSFSEEQRTIVSKGAENSEKVIDLLNELVIANQNEEYNLQYQFARTDLEHLLENIITEYLEESRIKDINLVFNRPGNPLPLVEIDADKLGHVFRNLLDNAIKYSNQEDTITVSIGEKDGNLVTSIKDTGIGVPEEQQEKLFQKFFRGDNAKERKKHGTGLGLFTAKKIVERHHGTITFESKEDKGTTFYVTIPIQQG